MGVFQGKKVIVIGLAKSGIAAAEKLKEEGAEVLAVDCAETDGLKKTVAELERKEIKTRLGHHRFQDLEGKQLVVVSPGVSKSSPILVEAHRRRLPVWSEVELASSFTDCPIIGVTGTNGKTTVTTLIGELLKAAGKPVIVSGNIGYPMTTGLKEAGEGSFFVVELSSFQLEHIHSFCPWVAVLLNITEDHLDWHLDFDDYVRAKTRLFENQSKADHAILNFDDRVVRSLAPQVKANLISFSKSERQKGGLYLEDGWIKSEVDGKHAVIDVSELKIKGEHNIDNAMAAIAAAQVADVPLEIIRRVLVDFKGLKHRLEFVAEINGASYYNDSKATNPDATARALTAFRQPIILLAGGRNKGNSFIKLAKAVEGKTKTVILFGEAADEIKAVLNGSKVEIVLVSTLLEAVKEASTAARSGDVVLLSPACASFDQFQNYQERGKVFVQAVERSREAKVES